MSRSTDKLAFALATPEPLSDQYFRTVFDHLYITGAAPLGYSLEDIDKHRLATRLNLEALSICDFEFRDRQVVRSCPPYLGLLPHAGFPTAILFGARTPSTRQQLRAAVRELRQHAKLEVLEQAGFPLLPHRISIKARDLPTLRAIAQSTSIPLFETAPSWLLLSYPYSVAAYSATLPWKQEVPNLNWQREDFDIRTLSFGRVSSNNNLRLTRYLHPQQRHRRIHYLIDDGRSTEIDPTWARFYLLNKHNWNVLLYNEEQSVILLPASLRLPRLLARGLVACSGLVSQEGPDHDGLRTRAFVQIPRSHADLLAHKLGQRLSLTTLRITTRLE